MTISEIKTKYKKSMYAYFYMFNCENTKYNLLEIRKSQTTGKYENRLGT